MAREHCFYEDIFNYIVHGTYWIGASDLEKDKLHRESSNYSVIQGNLFHTSSSSKKLQQVIAKELNQQSAIFECHVREDTGDHLNAKTTCFNLRKKYHWRNMDSDVTNFIKSCQECNSVDDGNMCHSKSNESIEFLDRVWKLIEVNIIGPLVFCEKEMFLLRLTDIFSKWMSYNFLSEINFKDISSMLLREFSIMGFPAGIRLVGVENSEKFIDTFEVALKDFMNNVNKINLMLSKENKLSEIENLVDDHKELIPKNDDESCQKNIDCDILNILENAEINQNSEKKDSMSIDELDVTNYENDCELNDDTKIVRAELKVKNCESCIEQKNEAKEVTLDKPEIKNYGSDVQMEDKANVLTIESEIKNCGNAIESSNETKVASISPEIKNCKNDIQMMDEANVVTVESEIKNCENGVESSNETKVANISSQIKNFENNIHMMDEANIVTFESEMRSCEDDDESNNETRAASVLPQTKNCENNIQMVDEANIVTIESEIKNTENNVESSNEIKTANVSPQMKNCENDVDVTSEIKISAVEQESANCDNNTEANNEIKISIIEPKTKIFNHKPNNKEDASELEQNSLSKDIAQTLYGKEDGVKLDFNTSTPVLSQNERDISYEQNAGTLNDIPVVKRVIENENIFKELGDFETFLKSSEAKENSAKPLLYFFLAQQSLLDSETQNICRTYLKNFIEMFPDSWTDNLSYFNFHIRNSLSTSFQTPCQLLLHRDPHLLKLYKSRSLNQSFQNSYLQRETLHADHIGKTSDGSPEGKQAHLPVRDGYTMRSLSTSTSVRRHSRYGLRKSPKPNDSLGFSHQYVKSQKRSAGEDTKQKDCNPPLKTRRLSSYHSKRLNSIKQKTIENILKNYSLKSPIILLTPLPCSVVDNALRGKINALL